MSKQVQRRRGTTAEHSSFTGAVGELTVDTGKHAVVVHDGLTAGGFSAWNAAIVHAASSKATPVDADEVPLIDSADSNVLKRLTWANLKATLKTYFDTLYPSGSGTSTGTNTGDQTSVSGNAGTATALQTARNIDGQSFDGTANITVIAPGTHAATSKDTPVGADELPLVDSGASNVLKKLTWANLKAGVGAPSAAAQSDQETATSTTTYVSPGRQHFHPAHPKAIYQATITPTAVSGNASSINTGTEVITWSTSHGLATGDCIIPVTNAPGGTTNLSPYYVNALSSTTFSLYLTLADALADTNRVNLTSSTAMTMRKLVASNVISFGMSATNPIGGKAATTAMGLDFNLGTALSSAVAACVLQGANLVDTNAVAAVGLSGYPTTITTSVITYANAGISVSLNTGTAVPKPPGTWSQQGTTAFTVSFFVWGDL